METTEKHRVIESNAKLFLRWIREREGIAVWGCLNLADPAKTWSTPVKQESGEFTPKPHWSATNEPIRVITDMDEILVDTPKEVKRFHIALRRTGFAIKLTDGSSNRVRKAVAAAGEDAWYEFDGDDAVILVPGQTMTLREWANRYAE